MIAKKFSTKSLAALISLAALAGCQSAPKPADPTGLANPDMTRVLAAYQTLGAKPVDQLSVAAARSQATIGDAAAKVAADKNIPALAYVKKVSEIQVQGATGPLAARVYDPRTSDQAAPIIVYFHGGGFVTGNLNTYDATDRILASSTGAIVISVQYRLAPEHPFPAAQDDADAAYNWVLQHAQELGGDQRRVAVAGESAGGNLAIGTSIWARDKHLPLPVHELLIYPAVGVNMDTPSYRETTKAVPLNRDAMNWYADHFSNHALDVNDPRLDIVGKADLHGLPPTTIIAAQIDPLRSEDEALAQKMQAAGMQADEHTYSGVTHEFFGMGAVVPEAKQAEDYAATRLKQSFYQPSPVPAPVNPPLGKHHHHHHHDAN